MRTSQRILTDIVKLKTIFKGFMSIPRRSEKATPEVLKKTFVDVGSLITVVSSRDNQVLFGRRGTGKTHVLQYLAASCRDAGNIAVYIDLSNLGSSGSIYADTSRTIPERATRLLTDTLLAIHSGILDAVLNRGDLDLSVMGPLLDELLGASTRIEVVGTVEEEDIRSNEESRGSREKESVKFAKLPGYSIEGTTESQSAHKEQTRRKLAGTERYVLHFGEIASAFKKIQAAIAPHQLWIGLDEWSNLPLDLQPYLGDLFRRTLFGLSGVTVKIAAIEFRSNFIVKHQNNAYIGIEVGADVSADANLDDFMVFENDDNRSAHFYQELLHNHLSEILANEGDSLPSAQELVRIAFSQENVFYECIRAGEGVPRDFINILSLAAQRAGEDKIAMKNVRHAALSWYQTGKVVALKAKEEANRLLEWIIEDVIRKRKTRAFLVQSQSSHPLLDELFDARAVHVVKRRVSSNDMPGERFDVFKVDYGCYVDLIGTASAPKALFEADTDDDKVELVEVPKDDYRSIRRAILDFGKFEQQAVQGLLVPKSV
jgi:hypothetical protein